jgi:hypothetical protein
MYRYNPDYSMLDDMYEYEIYLNECVYCGGQKQGIDHFIPMSHLHKLIKMNEPIPHELLILVPSCNRCNAIAGDRVFSSIESKTKYILERQRNIDQIYRDKQLIQDWIDREFLWHSIPRPKRLG